jgi:hypothetical protein
MPSAGLSPRKLPTACSGCELKRWRPANPVAACRAARAFWPHSEKIDPIDVLFAPFALPCAAERRQPVYALLTARRELQQSARGRATLLDLRKPMESFPA